MLKKRLKQYCVLRQKRRLGGEHLVFTRKGGGSFSPRRVTNFFLKVTNPALKSSGCSVGSNDITNLEQSYLAIFSGFVL